MLRDNQIRACRCSDCATSNRSDSLVLWVVALGFILIPGRVALHYATGLFQ